MIVVGLSSILSSLDGMRLMLGGSSTNISTINFINSTDVLSNAISSLSSSPISVSWNWIRRWNWVIELTLGYLSISSKGRLKCYLFPKCLPESQGYVWPRKHNATIGFNLHIKWCHFQPGPRILFKNDDISPGSSRHFDDELYGKGRIKPSKLLEILWSESQLNK